MICVNNRLLIFLVLIQICTADSQEKEALPHCLISNESMSSQCKLCEKNYVLSKEKECITQCPEGTLPMISGIEPTTQMEIVSCDDCPENCQNCFLHFNMIQCLECHYPWFLQESSNQCITKCEDNDYRIQKGQIRKCLRCPKNCSGCSDNRGCIKCSKGFEFDNQGKCILTKREHDGNENFRYLLISIGMVLFGVVIWWSWVQKKREEEEQQQNIRLGNIPSMPNSVQNSVILTENEISQVKKTEDDIDFGLVAKKVKRNSSKMQMANLDLDEDVFDN